MARRGRCRCGVILTFRKTAVGYKTRCPNCQAVVRLRVDATPGAAGPPPLPPVTPTPNPVLREVSVADYIDPNLPIVEVQPRPVNRATG
jgi:hypothetical protein